MKQLSIALITILFATAFTSCKKDSAIPASQNLSIEGIWNGNYHYDDSTTTYFYRLKIKSGGVIERLTNSNEVDGTGTWVLNGNQLTATYKNLPAQTVTYTITATWDSATNKLVGETASSNSNIFTSFFTLTKM